MARDELANFYGAVKILIHKEQLRTIFYLQGLE